MIDNFQYALMTAGIGMGIVFFFLLFLCLLMLVLKLLMIDRPAKVNEVGGTETTEAADTTPAPADTTPPPGPDTPDDQGIPRWATAGAVAYLLAEDEQFAPHAGAWMNRLTR